MELQKQVCSLELAQKLKELGVKQESVFFWLEEDNLISFDCDNIVRIWNGEGYEDGACAFTVAELGEMLKGTGFNKDGNGYFRQTFWFSDKWWSSMDTKNNEPPITADTEADARAKMLIYLIENKLITL